MTCSMVVNSKSGNTRMVSGAIKRALRAAGVEFIHAAALSDDADPEQVTHEAEAPALPIRCSLVFGATRRLHALGGGAAFRPARQARLLVWHLRLWCDQSYYQQIIDRVSSNLAEDAELAGWAMCQGKMGLRSSSAMSNASSKIPTMPA